MGSEPCAICLDPTEAINSHKFTCCNKTFHVMCVAGWLRAPKQPRSCPTCRGEGASVRKFTERSDGTIGADDMVWPCSACNGGDADSGAVSCQGRKCLIKVRKMRNGGKEEVYALDASGMCYDCYGVTAESVDAAPEFICARCT
jgi:hypothetical protein